MARQLTLDLRTPPALSRADFLPAPANRAALAALDAPQDWPQGRLLLVMTIPGSGMAGIDATIVNEDVGVAAAELVDLMERHASAAG